jgi:hypothetical protein
MKRVVFALVVLLVIAHQDYWAWDLIDPLAFGFMPIGLTWHVGISIGAALVWAIAVKYCWPDDVETSHGDVAARSDKAES